MFAIYGISGPIYQGPLEDLGPLPPVARRGLATPIRRIGEDTARRRLVRLETPTAAGSSESVAAKAIIGECQRV